MGRSAKPVEAGEVVLVGKPPTINTIAPTALDKLKPKKERSEKQKESIQKLIDINKKKAAERKGVVTGNVPEVIPEDKVLLTVLPKRKYVRKAPAWNAKTTPEPTPVPTPEETEEEEEAPPPRSKAVKKKEVVKKVSKPKKRYETETSETSGYDDSQSSEEEDDERLEKYVRKTHKRVEAIQSIENRLKAMKEQGRYSSYSIF